MVEVPLMRAGKTYDVLARWKARLGIRKAAVDATRAEVRAVLRALGELPPAPESKLWKDRS